MTDKADILLSRYFSGEATENELQQLDAWLAESDENEAYFDQMTLLYQESAMLPPVHEYDMERALSDFSNYMNKNSKLPERRKFTLSPFYKVVAASVILLLGMFTFYILYEPIRPVRLVADDSIQEFTLYEDAILTLEPNSQIIYSSENTNEVELKGKATFTVDSNQEKKLLVQAGETFIRDIGTIFTINAYHPLDSVVVEVFEGEVLFYTGENKGILVSENETAVYYAKTKEFFLIGMQETEEEIIFSSTPLYEVVNILSARYNVNISIKSSDLQDMQISVSFDKHESIDNILEIVAETLGLDISKDNDTYLIK